MTLRLRYPNGTVETYRDDGAGLDTYVQAKGWFGAIRLETGDGWPIGYDEAARRWLERGDASIDDDAAEERFESKPRGAWIVLAIGLVLAILAGMIGQAVGSVGG